MPRAAVSLAATILLYRVALTASSIVAIAFARIQDAQNVRKARRGSVLLTGVVADVPSLAVTRVRATSSSVRRMVVVSVAPRMAVANQPSEGRACALRTVVVGVALSMGATNRRSHQPSSASSTAAVRNAPTKDARRSPGVGPTTVQPTEVEFVVNWMAAIV